MLHHPALLSLCRVSEFTLTVIVASRDDNKQIDQKTNKKQKRNTERYVWMDRWDRVRAEKKYQLVHNVGKLSGRSEMPAIVDLPEGNSGRYMYCLHLIQQISSTPICYDVSVR